ncbi:FCS-Like Zinc finger 17-like isoform X2 [Benincasa hispida]|uniref:FCS-Like Zinc finger 17-like isoform X2 n=1 Tax=Benincasa hispida TaxID=102211 RepID=UPI0018FF74AE|nr:FCS-Like Zinc finger 17-like isoform X2 [Benincasa hispida]
MLPKLSSPFRMKNRNDNSRSYLKGVGLGILVHRSPEPNLVVKQSRKFSPSLVSSSNNNPSFLKTCSLCHKNLDPQEDIYMGDQGYCSIKCRNQQIDIDEKRELEASTRKMVASYRQCLKNEQRTETRFLLEDLRQQHNRLPHPRIRPVVS